MFTCPKCKKVFRDNFNLEQHQTFVTDCDEKILIDRQNDKDSTCKWCDQVFAHKYSLKAHLNNNQTKCYINRMAVLNLQMFSGQLDEIKHAMCGQNNDILAIKNSISDISSLANNDLLSIKNSISNIEKNDLLAIKNSISNIEKNGVGNNVIIVKPGHEDIKHITKEVMLKLLGNYSFIDFSCELVKLTYFNLKVRKNCAWCLIYPKNGKAGLEYNHEMGGFERKSTIDIVDDKFANLLTLVQPLIEEINKEDELLDNLNQYQKRNIKEFYEHFGMTNIAQNSPKLYEALHDVSYNYKTVPMAAWKEQGLNANHLSIKFH